MSYSRVDTISRSSVQYNIIQVYLIFCTCVSTDTCMQYVKYLLSSFIFGFVFFLLAARSWKQQVWRDSTIACVNTFSVWLTSSGRNVGMFLSIPVHVLLSVRVVVVLQHRQKTSHRNAEHKGDIFRKIFQKVAAIHSQLFTWELGS